MSVGAGSIKRAANAAGAVSSGNASNTINETENQERAARAEAVIQKAESRLAARKAAEGKPVVQKTADTPVRTENAVKTDIGNLSKDSSSKEEAEFRKEVDVKEQVNSGKEAGTTEQAASGNENNAAEGETGKTKGQYVTYGIGQQLPVYLL